MNSIATTGVVLTRVNYRDADKILTMLTPDHGKIRVIAKGVRREKSKLAGGIELFSISTITYIPGRGEIGTLISTRLVTYYARIVENMIRTMLGYEILKIIHKVTQDECEAGYYHLLVKSLASLNNPDISPRLIELWFAMQLLLLLGHQPSFSHTAEGAVLSSDKAYMFDHERMSLVEHPRGTLSANHIKILRLLGSENPQKLSAIKNLNKILIELETDIKRALSQYVH